MSATLSRELKAIETVFMGYRFRSRLEARWAVFFHELGLEFEYEPEGFDLGVGMRYLPDFRVQYPGRDPSEAHYQWFEVKGDAGLITPDEWRRLDAFDRAVGLTLLNGRPQPRMYNPIRDYTRPDGGDCQPPVAAHLANLSAQDNYGYALWSRYGRLYFDWREDFFDQNPASQKIKDACLAACQARFEHRQCGAPNEWPLAGTMRLATATLTSLRKYPR